MPTSSQSTEYIDLLAEMSEHHDWLLEIAL